jgi:AcrR family transcriptional regulator
MYNLLGSVSRMNEIKQKILNISRDLFIEQGYKKTTTRQIIQKAAILNGSLYHFFENKEDIFKQIIVTVADEAIKLAKDLAHKYSDTRLIDTLPDALQLYAIEKHAKLAELFFEAYSAWPILITFTKITAVEMRETYQEYNPDFTEEDYYLRALAIVGCVRNFIAESFFEGNSGYQDKLAVILKMYQMLFNIPAFDIQDIIAKIEKIINTEEIVIYGVKI